MFYFSRWPLARYRPEQKFRSAADTPSSMIPGHLSNSDAMFGIGVSHRVRCGFGQEKRSLYKMPNVPAAPEATLRGNTRGYLERIGSPCGPQI